ncbi:hypothetical protein B9Z19DRAFT_1072290 [Tuber borchii]|uniref:Small RNA 2'-O-methyltransferase n=1 Tax=Tuber borchii TaxID=42251 RepID=A0A2T7A709_TUBBO|nr:hypothetical protein B9Z19DRAFT_1072290 [Tuber borchii]
MRHHDHRFEWTRSEFRAWARDAAEKFGYKVKFTGVGSFGYGMMIENVDAAVVEEYLAKDMSGRVDEPEDADYFPQELVEGSLAKRAHRVYGDCTQIAVFTIKPDNSDRNNQELCEGISLKHALKTLPPAGVTGDGICLVKHVEYPWVDSPYPPRTHDALVLIQDCLDQFIPTPVYDAWSNPPIAEWDKPRETGVIELSFEDEDPVAKRNRERNELRDAENYTARLLQGKNLADLQVLVVPVDLKRIWESNWKLQRAFRFDYQMFTVLFHLSGAPGWKLNDMTPLGTECKFLIEIPKQELKDSTGDEVDFTGEARHNDYKRYISTQGFQIKYSTPQNPVMEAQPEPFPLSYGVEDQPNIWADFTFTPGVIPKTCEEDDHVVLTLGKNGTIPVPADCDDKDMCGGDILWVTFRKGAASPSRNG